MRENSCSRREARQLVAAALLASAMLAKASAATALVVDPFFAGHGTLTSASALSDYVVNAGFDYIPGGCGCSSTQITIDPAGVVTDSSFVTGSGILVPNWSGADFDMWAPLWNNQDPLHAFLFRGGEITYGNPAPGVFAVSWINVVNGDDPTIQNTFQVIFVGASASGFHTNTGIAISPGSVIFAYGGPSGPSGTVNLSDTSPAAIGLWGPGYSHGGPPLVTLNGIGVGDSNGVVTTADLAALRNSGDPFLFNFSSATGTFDQPVGFASVPELVPEPATLWLLGLGLAALAAVGTARRAPAPAAADRAAG